jgi:hypothetical protein
MHRPANSDPIVLDTLADSPGRRHAPAQVLRASLAAALAQRRDADLRLPAAAPQEIAIALVSHPLSTRGRASRRRSANGSMGSLPDRVALIVLTTGSGNSVQRVGCPGDRGFHRKIRERHDANEALVAVHDR